MSSTAEWPGLVSNSFYLLESIVCKAAAATVAYIPTQLACFITLPFSSEGEHESKIKQQHLEICYQHKYLFLSNNKVFILHNGYETTGTQGDAD